MTYTLERAEPCASCPYRKDAPPGFWHPSEFVRLLAADANPIGGAIYGCHGDGKKPQGERGFCIGWLLDQRRRNLPSIQLRITITRHPEITDRFAALKHKPRRYFPSIAAMCPANGVPVRGR